MNIHFSPFCQTYTNIMSDLNTLPDPGMSLLNFIYLDMVRRRPALAEAIMEYEKQFVITPVKGILNYEPMSRTLCLLSPFKYV